MNKIFFTLIAINTSLANAWSVMAIDIDDWGYIGTSGISGPDADYGYFGAGGTSQVLDRNGNCVGYCGSSQPNDPKDDMWKLTNLIYGDRFSMQFQVSAYTLSSAQNKGWAKAGYIIAPLIDSTQTNLNLPIAARALPIGIKPIDNLYYQINYTAGKKLAVELISSMDSTGRNGYEDSTHGVPRFEITGTGSDQNGTKAISAIKYSWGSGTPDYSKAVAIGFYRYLEAGTQGAEFPSTEPLTTQFDFISVGNESSSWMDYFDKRKNNLSINTPTQTTTLQIPIIQGILHLNDGQKAKVWNVQGNQVLEGQGTLDLGLLGPGSWMIQVRDGDHIQSGIYQQF